MSELRGNRVWPSIHRVARGSRWIAGSCECSICPTRRLGIFWDDHILILHGFQSCQELGRMPLDLPPPILAFSPDARQIAISQPDEMSLWAIPEPAPPETTPPGNNPREVSQASGIR